MSEPEGLGMSLDDLIKKKSQGGRGSFHSQRGGGRAGGGLGPRGGGVQKHSDRKPFSPKKVSEQQQFQRPVRQPQAFQRGGFGGRHGNQFSQRRGGFAGRGGFGGRHQHQQPNGNAPGQALSVQTFFDEATGNVVVKLKDTEIVTVSPGGAIALSTGGWFTNTTLEMMNKALGVLQIRVTANGDVRDGNWQISYGAHLLRFYDGIILHPKNPATAAQRAPIVLAAMTGAPAVAPAAATMAAFTAVPNVLIPSTTAAMSALAVNPLVANPLAANPLAATATSASSALLANIMARARASMGLGAAQALGGVASAAQTQSQQQQQQHYAALAALAAAQQQPQQLALAGLTEETAADADMVRRLKAQGRL